MLQYVSSNACVAYLACVFVFFKQKTAYEMRISDWSSDVCSSDLLSARPQHLACAALLSADIMLNKPGGALGQLLLDGTLQQHRGTQLRPIKVHLHTVLPLKNFAYCWLDSYRRSEEHTSELQSLMRNSYAVFCLTKKR